MALIVFGMSLILFVFISITALHMGFVMLLGFRLLQFNQSKKNTDHKSISVIVAARNEGSNIPKLVDQLANQKHPDFELILVNDRSTDGSGKIINEFAAYYDWLKPIHIEALPEGWTGKKYALYSGVKQAKNDVLVFTDADCLPTSENWFDEISAHFESEVDIVLGYSPYEPQSSFLNSFIQFETLLVGLQYLGFSLLGKTYMGVGRNMAIRRSSYDLDFLKAIKNLEGGDDDLMVSRLAKKGNTSIMLEKESFIVSKPKTNLKDYIKQKTRHLSAGKHYHKKDQTLLGIFTLSWLVVWGLLIYLIISGASLKIVLMVFGIRSLAVYLILNRLGRKLNTNINFWALPFLDFCYCFYYPWVAIKALATKQVEWK